MIDLDQESLEKIEEGRKLLEALGQQVSGKSPLEIMKVMAGVGLEYLRAAKLNMDAAKAREEIARRIYAGPRPSPKEAGLN